MEVLREIKSDPKTQLIPVVILTSSSIERDIRNGYDRGANSYIVKPVNYDQFMTMVSALGTYWLKFNKTMDRAAPGAA
jgi:CheY-like chemotaxis protein